MSKTVPRAVTRHALARKSGTSFGGEVESHAKSGLLLHGRIPRRTGVGGRRDDGSTPGGFDGSSRRIAIRTPSIRSVLKTVSHAGSPHVLAIIGWRSLRRRGRKSRRIRFSGVGQFQSGRHRISGKNPCKIRMFGGVKVRRDRTVNSLKCAFRPEKASKTPKIGSLNAAGSPHVLAMGGISVTRPL